MAWGKLASVTSGTPVTNANITSPVFTPSEFMQEVAYLSDTPSSNHVAYMRMGTDTIDTGNNYAFRYKEVNTADTSSGVSDYSRIRCGGDGGFDLQINDFCNIDGKQTFVLSRDVRVYSSQTTSAHVPDHRVTRGKWITTTQANIIQANCSGIGSRQYLAGSQINLIGSEGGGLSENITDGAIFYEKDTNKEFILSNNTWTEL